MSKKCNIAILVLILAITGCAANYSVKPDEFVNQVAQDQYRAVNSTGFYVGSPLASLFSNQRYAANKINKILCKDKEGNQLYLFPGRNTQLEIKTITTNDVVKMYFDTVFFEGSKLVGLRSRLIPGMTREIDISDIASIDVYDEFPRTEKVAHK